MRGVGAAAEGSVAGNASAGDATAGGAAAGGSVAGGTTTGGAAARGAGAGGAAAEHAGAGGADAGGAGAGWRRCHLFLFFVICFFAVRFLRAVCSEVCTRLRSGVCSKVYSRVRYGLRSGVCLVGRMRIGGVRVPKIIFVFTILFLPLFYCYSFLLLLLRPSHLDNLSCCWSSPHPILFRYWQARGQFGPTLPLKL